MHSLTPGKNIYKMFTKLVMNFGFLIFSGMEELDMVGPWEMISLWSKFAQGPEKCFMVAENPGLVICERGMSVNPNVTFSDCPPLDFLPGAGWPERRMPRG